MAVTGTDTFGNQILPALNSAGSKALGVLSELGKVTANNLYPDEIEYYLCALEVVDSANNSTVLQHITFPIMPESIKISDQKVQSTTKTTAGLVVLENLSFTPKTINISGNFGRKFKTLNGQNGFTTPGAFKAAGQSTIDKVFKKKSGKVDNPIFDATFKTGYGMTKILEEIFNASSTLNNSQPVMVFFYCYAFNYNFLVQLNNIQFSQSKNMNMIWEYNMSMTALAPADQIMSGDDYKNVLSKYTKQSFLKTKTDAILSFTKDEATIGINRLENLVGNSLGVSNENFIQGIL